MAKEQKVYMPLMIGDWLKGTRGMKAEVRGVYLGLLLYQWDNGFIPSDMEELCLIDPEVPKVWDKIKMKFIEIAPGKLQNKKNLEVKEFWAKQKKNGENGGRPKKDNPKGNLNNNPKDNPNLNLHNDIDLDNDFELKIKKESVRNVPRGTDEQLWDIEDWTEDVLSGNDEVFIQMTKHIALNGQLEDLARSHLGLCSRYNWHKNMESQQQFRNSLMNHITENLKTGKTESKNGKPAVTLEQVRAGKKNV